MCPRPPPAQLARRTNLPAATATGECGLGLGDDRAAVFLQPALQRGFGGGLVDDAHPLLATDGVVYKVDSLVLPMPLPSP